MLTDDQGRLVLDNTKLSAFRRCEWAYWLEHVLGRQQPGEAAVLKAGADVHEALAYFFEPKNRFDAAGAVKVFKERYEDWARVNVEWDDSMAYNNQAAILWEYFQRVKARGAGFEVVVVEQPFEVELRLGDETVIFVGKFDAIVRKDGRLYVLDHKCTGSYLNEQWYNQFRTGTQMTGYVMAAKALGYQEVAGVLINAISSRKVPNSPRKCTKHDQPYAECGHLHIETVLFPPLERSDEDIEEWMEMVDRTVREMRAVTPEQYPLEGEERPMKTGAWNAGLVCKWCSHQTLCCGPNDEVSLRQGTIGRMWDPRKEALVAVATEGGEEAAKRREEEVWTPTELK